MPETLFLTTNLIDRFLEKKRVSRRNLQLVRCPLWPRLLLHSQYYASVLAANACAFAPQLPKLPGAFSLRMPPASHGAQQG